MATLTFEHEGPDVKSSTPSEAIPTTKGVYDESSWQNNVVYGVRTSVHDGVRSTPSPKLPEHAPPSSAAGPAAQSSRQHAKEQQQATVVSSGSAGCIDEETPESSVSAAVLSQAPEKPPQRTAHAISIGPSTRTRRWAQRQVSVAWWLAASIGTTLFVLFVVVLAYAVASDGRTLQGLEKKAYSLPVLLMVLAALWLGIASVARAALPPPHRVPLPVPPVGGLLVLGGALALTFELTIRLLAAPHFGGDAALFNFGLKCGWNATDGAAMSVNASASASANATGGAAVQSAAAAAKLTGTAASAASAATAATTALATTMLANASSTNASSCQKLNLAFSMSFGTFGHCGQGLLALFLFFPCVERLTARCGFVGPVRELLAACCVGYPIYSTVKRGLFHATDFAASSFSNNGAEWCFGFLIGLSAGVLLTAVCNAYEAVPGGGSDGGGDGEGEGERGGGMGAGGSKEGEGEGGGVEPPRSLAGDGDRLVSHGSSTVTGEEARRRARTDSRLNDPSTRRLHIHDHVSYCVCCPAASRGPCSATLASRWVKLASRWFTVAVGVMLWLSVIFSAVLFGATWDNTAYREHEDSPDTAFTIVFATVPVLMAIAVMATAVYYRCRTLSRNKSTMGVRARVPTSSNASGSKRIVRTGSSNVTVTPKAGSFSENMTA